MKLRDKPKWFRKIYSYRWIAYLLCLILIILAVIYGPVVFRSFRQDSAAPNESAAAESAMSEELPKTNELFGTYTYGSYVAYTFDGREDGAMLVDNETNYKFKYYVNQNALTIEFSEADLVGQTYSFSLNEDRLILIGTGNTHGSYSLKKQS